MKVLEQLVDAYVAPLLTARGFRRSKRSFFSEDPSRVTEVAIERSKDGQRCTAFGAVAFRMWNDFLRSSKSLEHPVRYPDFQSILMGTDPATGLQTHRWYDLNEQGARSLASHVEEQMLPDLATNGTPAADYAGLKALLEEGKCPPELLPRLFFWALTFPENRTADGIAQALVDTGQRTMRERIERYMDEH